MSETNSTASTSKRRPFHPWTPEELQVLREQYPRIGLGATAFLLGCGVDRVRSKASLLGIKQDRTSPFFRHWQKKAARGKIGKKRPEHSSAMKAAYATGRLGSLSVFTAERCKSISEQAKERIRVHGHPRGAKGMKHTPSTLAVLSQCSKEAWQSRTPKERRDMARKTMETRAKNGTVVPNRKRGTWKSEWREIGGKRKFYRSRWEANYARFLEWQKQRGEIAAWEHESETFWFDGVKRGNVSYLPDFKVTLLDGSSEYHEVKGWMDKGSKTKIKRMKKYHPQVKLVVIEKKAYGELERLFQNTIPDWEKPVKRPR